MLPPLEEDMLSGVTTLSPQMPQIFQLHTALPEDTFVIFNFVTENTIETPKLHLGKEKRPKIS